MDQNHALTDLPTVLAAAIRELRAAIRDMGTLNQQMNNRQAEGPPDDNGNEDNKPENENQGKDKNCDNEKEKVECDKKCKEEQKKCEKKEEEKKEEQKKGEEKKGEPKKDEEKKEESSAPKKSTGDCQRKDCDQASCCSAPKESSNLIVDNVQSPGGSCTCILAAGFNQIRNTTEKIEDSDMSDTESEEEMDVEEEEEQEQEKRGEKRKSAEEAEGSRPTKIFRSIDSTTSIEFNGVMIQFVGLESWPIQLFGDNRIWMTPILNDTQVGAATQTDLGSFDVSTNLWTWEDHTEVMIQVNGLLGGSIRIYAQNGDEGSDQIRATVELKKTENGEVVEILFSK